MVSGSVPDARPSAEVDPAREQPGQQAEALGDLERRVVREHHAAAADADPLGGRRHRAGQHLRRRTGQREAVVLGEPVAVIAEAVGELREVERVAQRVRPRRALRHRRLVEDAKPHRPAPPRPSRAPPAAARTAGRRRRRSAGRARSTARRGCRSGPRAPRRRGRCRRTPRPRARPAPPPRRGPTSVASRTRIALSPSGSPSVKYARMRRSFIASWRPCLPARWIRRCASKLLPPRVRSRWYSSPSCAASSVICAFDCSACSTLMPYLAARCSAGGVRALGRSARVELEAAPGQLDLVTVRELLERMLEASLADVAPGAHDVGPDLDGHRRHAVPC